jgi:hypothetical protein
MPSSGARNVTRWYRGLVCSSRCCWPRHAHRAGKGDGRLGHQHHRGGSCRGNPYVLTVTADDANANISQLSSVTVHVYSGGNDVYTTPAGDMAYVSGPPTAQIWTATSPIPEADLPPGTYSITVDATDTSPETDDGLAGPGTFSFSWTTNVSATASPAVLSYGKTTTTISGQVTGYVPSSSYITPVGLADVPVYVNWVNGDSGPWDEEIGTTAADGTYSDQVQLPEADGEYTVSVNATPTMGAASTRSAAGSHWLTRPSC